MKTKQRRPAVVVGDKFDKLTAVREAERGARGRLRWVFRCTCGREVTWNVHTVTWNARRLGWCSCTECYRAAGGLAAIVERLAGEVSQPKRSSPQRKTKAADRVMYPSGRRDGGQVQDPGGSWTPPEAA